ncbi:ribbon-helix-helix protein, CopG family [Nocardia harenae]|uniref:ribbon-helix-helix protein, CopG family n=1 Tax=Nocardia harenae TaxID=358707 RepID=UPI000834DB5E|nr:ribbon-helix-helix protein, CopG family [Nocardia harenae]
MSIQISVRLEDSLVGWLDRAVALGEGSSRAAIIEQALERDRMRRAAERDAAILMKTAPDRDMEELAHHDVSMPMSDLA